MNSSEPPRVPGAAFDATFADAGLRIGERLEQARKDVMASADKLMAVLGEPLAGLAGGVLAEVKQHICRIAIIGQVKAGKSSFVNAFTARPGLLPTDINPWTAVITKMHFGTGQGEGGSAVFRFFDAEEWHRLSSDGGRLGELTRRTSLLYDQQQLSSHLDELRQRAERRLGDKFGHFLGRHHLFSSVTSEVLERYVSAGSPPDTLQRHNIAGRYSEITKTADLYFEQPPFAVPAMVIDTPGTNDASLVRDEITLDALGDADVYIMVLTAQQPLSVADLTLFRILNGLQKDRIAVFINRIDMLDDIAGETGKIVRHVESVLAHEFPGANIPIVAGSAFWGRAALSGDASITKVLLAPAFAAYAMRTGIIRLDDILLWRRSQGPDRPKIPEMLYACSGLPKMAGIISTLMLKASAPQLAAAAAFLAVLAENGEFWASRRLATLADAPALLQKAPLPLAQEHAGLSAEIDALQTGQQAFRHALDGVEESFAKVREESAAHMRAALEALAEDCAARQQALFLALPASESSMAGFRRDIVAIRQKLAAEFARAYREACGPFIAAQHQAAEELHSLLRDAALEQVSFPAAAAPALVPCFTPLSQAAAFDLDATWQSLQASHRQNPAEAAQSLAGLIRTELALVVNELVRQAGEDMDTHLALVLRFLRDIGEGAIADLLRQKEELARAYAMLLHPAGFGAPHRWGPDDAADSSCLRDNIATCQALAAQFRTLREEFAAPDFSL